MSYRSLATVSFVALIGGLQVGCLTRAPQNPVNLLEPISTNQSSGTNTLSSKYLVVTGSVSGLTDSSVLTMLNQLKDAESVMTAQSIPNDTGGSLSVSANDLLVRVIKGTKIGQESLEIQKAGKKESFVFPYVEANTKKLASDDCKGESVYEIDDPICNIPRVMGLYGPFNLGSTSMLIYTVSTPQGLVEPRALSLETYKEATLPFVPVRYSSDRSTLIVRAGEAGQYRIVNVTSGSGTMPLIGETLDGLFVSEGKIYAHRHDYDSQIDTTTLRVIDLATNQILHNIDNLQDLGKYPVFIQDPNNPDAVVIRFTKVFFDTEQQKDYLMNLNLKTRVIEWMIQL